MILCGSSLLQVVLGVSSLFQIIVNSLTCSKWLQFLLGGLGSFQLIHYSSMYVNIPIAKPFKWCDSNKLFLPLTFHVKCHCHCVKCCHLGCIFMCKGYLGLRFPNIFKISFNWYKKYRFAFCCYSTFHCISQRIRTIRDVKREQVKWYSFVKLFIDILSN